MNKKIRIAICDDDRTDIILFKKYISSSANDAFEIAEASGKSGLIEILSDPQNKTDVIFLDYYLGADSGIELLKELRKTNQAPVIMLTGRGDEEIAVECMKEGAVDYISKDAFPGLDFGKIIKQAIDKWNIERERDQLLGIAAHELRNPISVILGYTEMMLFMDDLNEDEKKSFLYVIHDRAKLLLNIINELLDITRIDKGIVQLNKSRADLVSLASKKAAVFRPLSQKKEINIEFDAASEKLELNIDEARIDEALSNFIDNAIKYSPKGTTIKISVSSDNVNARIDVIDQGLGIKESELKYLFELFSSSKISTLPTGDELRTGIGLAINKKVIDAHNGQILVESKKGRGSCFSILLPLNG